jgi:hypothetical protein
VFEWAISFGFTFYVITFYFDLRRSKGVPKNQFTREKLLAEGGFSRRRGRRGTVIRDPEAPVLRAPEMGNVGKEWVGGAVAAAHGGLQAHVVA